MALLSLKRTFETKILIDGVEFPVHVARLNRSQFAEVEEGWTKWCVRPRGSVPAPPSTASDDEKEAFKKADAEAVDAWYESVKDDQFRFLEEVISKHVTIDQGVLDVNDEPVTTGDGWVRVWYSRQEVLRATVAALWGENRLTPTLAKNSKSPSASATGSAPRAPLTSGNEQERTATSADSSNSAPADAATGTSEKGSADGSKSSRSGAGGAVH